MRDSLFSATLITTRNISTGGHSISIEGEIHHLHAPSIAKQEIRVFRAQVKRRVREELTPVTLLIEQEMRKINLSSEAQQLLTHPQHMKAAFSRERHKCIPNIPQSLDFIIPHMYTLTRGFERFLLNDKTTVSGGRLLIFSSNTQLDELFKSSYVFCDGTFSTVPLIFNQLYTFHGYRRNEVFPCAFALLGDKKTSTYIQMIEDLKTAAISMGTKFEPLVLMSDFETSLIKALPTTEHKGCFFHFNQSLHRRLVSEGLAVAYRDEEKVRKWSKYTMALALLPPNETENALQLIKLGAPKRMKKFVQYVQDFWFNKIGVNMWNVNDLKFRTNNACESWHARFARRVITKHPHIWRLIDALCGAHDFKLSRSKNTKMAEQKLAEIKQAYETGRLPLEQHLDLLADFVVGKKTT
ncbi:unnamed protein product [Rotaria socialis]|uniref:MULE transposase domain-containing protein n=2 Tax=Rotaria socialis TaxID=392032 RepID=A0A821DTG3_9BILA|nr:unnamed protein product [Rotaria socialis]